MIGFVIWSLLGVFIIGLGIKDMFSKNPVGFWANTETIKVKDVKGYNRASGLLFIIYGIIFVILGIPLLDGQNTPYVLLSGYWCDGGNNCNYSLFIVSLWLKNMKRSK